MEPTGTIVLSAGILSRVVCKVEKYSAKTVGQEWGIAMSDSISRQAAIDALEKLDIPEDMCVFEIMSHIELAIGTLPPAQPEPQWIPCSEKGVEFPCLACDVFGQMFITKSGIVKVNGEYYDGDGFDLDDAEEFLKGKKIGRSMRMLPRKIVAWMPLPEPYKEA